MLTPATGIDGFHYGDVYFAFDSSQIKSAAPITYDDDGNVIPLRERFNSKKNDMRYSIPEKNQKDRYWHTGMTNKEVSMIENLAKYESTRTDNYLDLNNKWLYTEREGKTYFALYSTYDTEPTPTVLYASKGKKANIENSWLEGIINKTKKESGDINDRTRIIVDRIHGNNRNEQSKNSMDNRESSDRRRGLGYAQLYKENTNYRPSRASLSCLEDIAREQEQATGRDERDVVASGKRRGV